MSSPADQLRFYSKSRDEPPGRGAGEVVANPAAYSRLARHRNWRHVLSNFDVCERGFVFNGWRYRTVEHAFHATKIAMVNPQAAFKFTMDSGDPLGRGNGVAAKKAGGRSGLVSMAGTQAMKDWEGPKPTPAQKKQGVKPKGGLNNIVMAAIQAAKFEQCPAARQVLLDTQNAQLWHIMRPTPVRFVGLERVRDRLRDGLPAFDPANLNNGGSYPLPSVPQPPPGWKPSNRNNRNRPSTSQAAAPKRSRAASPNVPVPAGVRQGVNGGVYTVRNGKKRYLTPEQVARMRAAMVQHMLANAVSRRVGMASLAATAVTKVTKARRAAGTGLRRPELGARMVHARMPAWIAEFARAHKPKVGGGAVNWNIVENMERELGGALHSFFLKKLRQARIRGYAIVSIPGRSVILDIEDPLEQLDNVEVEYHENPSGKSKLVTNDGRRPARTTIITGPPFLFDQVEQAHSSAAGYGGGYTGYENQNNNNYW